MGQKVHPTGFRLGTTEQWRSRWYADKNYAETLGNDLAIRKFLTKRLERAALSRVDIERAGDKVQVTIYTARPGIVIGKKGAEIDNLRRDLEKVVVAGRGAVVDLGVYHREHPPFLLALLVEVFNLLQLLAINKHLGSTTFIYNASSNTVSHRLCHCVAIYNIAKHIYCCINWSSCKTYVCGIW